MLGTASTGLDEDEWGLVHAFAVISEKDEDAFKRAGRYNQRGITLDGERTILGSISWTIPCAIGRGMTICDALHNCAKHMSLRGSSEQRILSLAFL